MESKLCPNSKCPEYMWEFKTDDESCRKCGKSLDNAFEFYSRKS